MKSLKVTDLTQNSHFRVEKTEAQRGQTTCSSYTKAENSTQDSNSSLVISSPNRNLQRQISLGKTAQTLIHIKVIVG